MRFFASLRMTKILLCVLSSIFLFEKSWAFEAEGKIQVLTPFPESTAVEVKRDKDFCGAGKISQELIVSKDGGVQNVVVSLQGPNVQNRFNTERPWPVLRQKKCEFVPHVLLIPREMPFLISTEDSVLHDVRVFQGPKMVFQFKMPSKAKAVEKKFDKPGVYTLRCGLHRWMYAVAVQTEHDYYAVTDEAGGFTIKNIAPGSYKLHLWHETLGEAEIPLEIQGSVKGISYIFPSPIKKA